MRKSLRTFFVLFCSTFLLYSCTKVSDSPLDEAGNVEKYDKKISVCQPLAFHTSSGRNGSFEHFTTFHKKQDVSGLTTEITAGIYSGGIFTDSIRLQVVYKPQQIAFVHAHRSTDTLIVAELDKKGNLVNVRNGNVPDENFLPTRFEYKGQHLKRMKIDVSGSQLVSEFLFDNKGNCIRIKDEDKSGASPRVDYQYDMNLKSSGDVYFHEPRRFVWNTFSLMEYAGLLPQLRSNNLRTRTTVIWDESYLAYDYSISNHRLNSNGNVSGYDVIDPVSNELITSHTITWSCGNTGKNPEQ